MKFDNTVVVFKYNQTKHLTVITKDQEFVTQNGVINFNDIKSLPSIVKTNKNIEYQVYVPSFDEFILLMKRGPQIIYPKDMGTILIAGNINKYSKILEIGTGSGALTLFLSLLLSSHGELFSLDESRKNQLRAKKTIDRFTSSISFEDKVVDVNYINSKLSEFKFNEIESEIDTIITDVPEPWEFFQLNKINKNIIWVSYLPSISQVEKTVNVLNENNFTNIKVTETLNREWIVNKKILRPKNEMVGHTAFVVSGRYLIS